MRVLALAIGVFLATSAVARADDPELSYPPERGRTAVAQTYAALLDECDRVISPKAIFEKLPTELEPARARIDAKAGILPKYSGDRARDLLALQRFPERSATLLAPSDRDGEPQLTFSDVMNAMKDASDDCVSFDYDDVDGMLDQGVGLRYTSVGFSTATDPGLRETRVSNVVAHSTAARVGLTEGDLIVDIDSDPENANAPERVTFEHDGVRHVVTLKPERLYHQTVFAHAATTSVGVLQLSGIGPNTATEFSEARAALLASGHTAFVVDLRDVKNADAPSVRELASLLVPVGSTSEMKFRATTVPFVTGGQADHVPTAIVVGEDTDAAALLLASAAHRGGVKIVGSSSNPFTTIVAYRKLASTTIMRIAVGEAARDDIDLRSDIPDALALDPRLALSPSDANDDALRSAIVLLSQSSQ
jgi:C-terminal processing protease CtpA/Prc